MNNSSTPLKNGQHICLSIVFCFYSRNRRTRSTSSCENSSNRPVISPHNTTPNDRRTFCTDNRYHHKCTKDRKCSSNDCLVTYFAPRNCPDHYCAAFCTHSKSRCTGSRNSSSNNSTRLTILSRQYTDVYFRRTFCSDSMYQGKSRGTKNGNSHRR